MSEEQARVLVIREPQTKEKPMFRRLKKTKQFIKDHPSATACVITAAVTWKLSHDIALAGVLERASEMSYQWGQQNGVLGLHNAVLMAFIDEKDMKDELLQFIGDLKES